MKKVYSLLGRKWYLAAGILSILCLQRAALLAQPCGGPPVILGDTLSCSHKSRTYTTPGIPGTSYRWSITGTSPVNSSTDTFITVQYNTPGKYTIKLTIGKGTCTDSATTEVTVGALPDANFTYSHPNSLIYSGEDSVVFTNTSAGTNTYRWNLGDGTIDDKSSTKHLYNKPGTYTVQLRVTDPSTLCESTTDKIIDVKGHEELYVPSGFTPNGDGMNDVFAIAVSEVAEIEVLVYNRLGVVIFSSHDPNVTWDGTYQGQPVQTDAYNYVITGKGTFGASFNKTGAVILLR